MSGNILSSLLSKASVVFLDQTTTPSIPIWLNLKVSDSEIIEESENIESPLYTSSDNSSNADEAAAGVLKSDLSTAKILDPIKISITGFVDDISTMESIIETFTNTTRLLTIVVKGATVSYLSLISIEFELSGEFLSTTKVKMMFETSQSDIIITFNPLQSADASLINLGNNVLSTVTKATSDVYSKVSTFLGL